MPGFSLYVGLGSEEASPPLDPIARTLGGLGHHASYSCEILCRAGPSVVASSRYPEYPLRVLETDRLHILLEGRVYHPPLENRADEWRSLAEAMLDPAGQTHPRCREWLLKTDGEYVVVAVDKASGDAAVLNDSLARLPCYYHAGPDRILVSREYLFIAGLMPAKSFDRLGMAEYLLFSYPLGERTLIAGVSRMPPGSLLRIVAREGRLSLTPIHTHNFEDKPHAGKTMRQNADALVDLFSWFGERRREIGVVERLPDLLDRIADREQCVADLVRDEPSVAHGRFGDLVVGLGDSERLQDLAADIF